MPVKAIVDNYKDFNPNRDLPEQYHGNLMVYLYWNNHMSFVAAMAAPLPPPTPFGALPEVAKSVYGTHPDFEKIDWSKVEWIIDGKPVNPDFSKSIGEQGVRHKSLIRFTTPGLNGYEGKGI